MADIELLKNNQHLVVNQLGGGIKEYYLDDGKDHLEIIYGYKSEEDKAGSMGDVLFPFPGRIENSEYEFLGQKYHLSGLKIKDGHAIHGFAKTAEFEVVDQSPNMVALRFEIREDEYRDKGFPFSLRLEIKYSLLDEGLTVEAAVLNFGQTKAPFGLGFHPYYSLGLEKLDSLSLKVAAYQLVEFAPNLKPTGKYFDVVQNSGLDFSTPKEIGDQVIDNCFFDLNYGADGKARTELESKDKKITIWQDKNLPYLQLYSADTIGESNFRKGLAIEPQTCTGFVLNMPEMGLTVLGPGETFFASWGVEI